MQDGRAHGDSGRTSGRTEPSGQAITHADLSAQTRDEPEVLLDRRAQVQLCLGWRWNTVVSPRLGSGCSDHHLPEGKSRTVPPVRDGGASYTLFAAEHELVR